MHFPQLQVRVKIAIFISAITKKGEKPRARLPEYFLKLWTKLGIMYIFAVPAHSFAVPAQCGGLAGYILCMWCLE